MTDKEVEVVASDGEMQETDKLAHQIATPVAHDPDLWGKVYRAAITALDEHRQAAEPVQMTDFTQYRRKQIAELRPYEPGESMDGISISASDKEAGSPKPGDMIARNPKNHDDKWLVAAQYFADNFEPVDRP